MSMIVLAIVLAITVEGVVEIGKSIGKAVLGGMAQAAGKPYYATYVEE